MAINLPKARMNLFRISWLNDVKRLSNAYGRKTHIAFDIGANIGITAIEMLEHFDSVYAFECHPSSFKALEQNLIGTRGHAFEVALSNAPGLKTLNDYGGKRHTNSLTSNARYAVRFNQKVAELQVTTNTIDRFSMDNSISTIDLLKIDTEGHDFSVIKGAERMFASNSVAFVYFEFNDFNQESGSSGGSLNEITDYLSKFGFQFVATYTDYILTDQKMFVVANALLFNPNASLN